jgi:hypothetical protein
MEPSPSLDATIVLRSSQGETHYGARVVINPSTGALRADLIDTPPEPGQPPEASLRSVSGRWLFDAAPEGRISINGVAVAGARIVGAGDVISVAGSQLLVEEAQPRSLALRLFELEGTDTLPPVGDSVQVVAAPAEDLPVDLGEVPSVEGAMPAARGPRAPRSRLNYAAWAMGILLVVVLGLFTLLRPIALDLQPTDAKVRSLGNFSWQSASSVFVFPGTHTLHAERTGYEPFELKVDASAALPRALIHLVKLPGQIEVDTGGVRAEISADGARVGAVPGTVAVPAGARSPSGRRAISIMSSGSTSTAWANIRNSRWRSSPTSR